MAAIDISAYPDERELAYSSPNIDILSDTLDPGSLVEVSGYDTFPAISAFYTGSTNDLPDDVPVCTTR